MKDSRKKSPFKRLVGYVALLAIGAGLGAGAYSSCWFCARTEKPYVASYPDCQRYASFNSGSQIQAVLPPISGNNNFIADAVNRTGPAVVRINASRTVETEQMPDVFNDPFFSDFFGDEIPAASPENGLSVVLGLGLLSIAVAILLPMPMWSMVPIA
jgi:serine protease Do